MKFALRRAPNQDTTEWMSREWLETNGRGGYASDTILGCHTRKYHALLAARLADPPGTFVLLSQLEDEIARDNVVYPLVTHQYPDVLHPAGYRNIVGYHQEHHPVQVFRCGETELSREILMLDGRDTVLLRYRLLAGPPCELRLRPLLAYRNMHDVMREQEEPPLSVFPVPGGIQLRHGGSLPDIFLWTVPQSSFHPEPLWYRNCIYVRDRNRQFDHQEDLFSNGQFRVKLAAGRAVYFAASLDIPPATCAGLWQNELRRRQKRLTQQQHLAQKRFQHPEVRRVYTALSRAADQMLITLPDKNEVINAGYHWFGPWGRDSLVAVPGLTFVRGELDRGLKILEFLAAKEKNGLLPNLLAADGTGIYTAVDPALWLFWTTQQYLKYGGKVEKLSPVIWPAMKNILHHYQRGTDCGIRTDAAGLLQAGNPGTAVSWMDATLNGRPIVQRWGYMVEINALWYNACRFAVDLAHTLDLPLPDINPDYCDRMQEEFVNRFLMPQTGMLLDTFNSFFQDASVRPNQIFAVSLPFSPLSQAAAKQVVNGMMTEELLTNYGLCTLSPNDSRFQPICQGPQFVRELAYHQGSVWPWLLAHFADAFFQVYGRNAETKTLFHPVLTALAAHLQQAGIGGVSEIFEGAPPHAPHGAISQAWNVGELLRLCQLVFGEDEEPLRKNDN